MVDKKIEKINLGEGIDVNKGLWITLGISVSFIAFSILMIFLSVKPEKIYAATVNGQGVPLTEYNQRVEAMKNQYVQMMRTAITDDLLSVIKKNSLDGMIEREILLQAAKEKDFEVEKSVIDAELQQLKEKNFGNDEKAFFEALRKANLTVSSLREQLMNDKMIEKLREQLTAEKVKITEEQQKKYYAENNAQFSKGEEVKASHILVKDEKQANEIYELASKGEDFAELAKKHSTDTGSKDNGGDLGFFQKGQMVPEFETAAWKLKNSEISKPVKSQFGYHIIKRIDFKPAENKTYEQAKTEIAEKLRKEKEPEIIRDFVKEQRSKAEVKIFVAVEPELAPKMPEKPQTPPKNEKKEPVK